MMKDNELDAMLAEIEARNEDEKELAFYEASDIALEINVIKKRLAQETILAAVEIGKLLCRAKDKVPHGMWGEWLEENVAYSQSTANNMMRLYREYGEKEQLDFFSENRLEIFGNLSQSQAVALLGIPYDKRREYVETHDMEKTSVREVEADVAAIRAEMEAEKRELEEELADVKEARDAICDELNATRDKLAESEAARDAAELKAIEAENGGKIPELEEQIAALKKEKRAHGKAAKALEAEKAELLRQLEEVRAAAAQVSIDTDEAKRAEIEAEVAATYEAKLEELRRESEKKITAAGNARVIEVNLLFGELQDIYAKIVALIAGIGREDAPMALKLKTALGSALETMAKD